MNDRGSKFEPLSFVVERWLSTALRVSAGHTGQAAVLVGHILLSALRTFALRARSVYDILFQRALYARFPRVYGLAVEVQAVD